MWSILPKNDLDDFVRRYPELQQNCDDHEFILQEKEKYVILPRFFYKTYPYHSLVLHEDGTFNEKSIDVEFSGDLRDNQKEPMNALMDMYNHNGSLSGILKGRCGFGKTVCSTWLSSKIGKKTMIILDNQELKKQWIDAFVNFTNLTEDDIGIIQGTKFDLDKPVSIAMVQTLMSRAKNDMKEYYDQIKAAGYGFIIFDEVHATSSAPKFAMASLFLNTHNVLGLTATPYGHGINKILLETTIGKVIYEISDYELIPEINFVQYDSGLGKKHGYRMSRSADYIRGIAYYNSIISSSQTYLETIKNISAKLLKENHRVLIITSTIKQLDIIVENLNNNGLNAIPFHAKVKELDRDKDRLLVATYKYVNKGFDYDELSSLVYALPLKGRTSLIQTAGRILRSAPGKPNPVIYDLIDTGFGKEFVGTIMTKRNVFKKEFGDKLIMRDL
jgi:superfamily II DNA or RNA helicase